MSSCIAKTMAIHISPAERHLIHSEPGEKRPLRAFQPSRISRRRLALVVGAALGVLWGLLGPLGWTWSLGIDTVWWQAGCLLTRAPRYGLHLSDLAKRCGGVIVGFVELPLAAAADVLQATIGSVAHLLGLGADRFSATAAVTGALGPAWSLAIWVFMSVLVGMAVAIPAVLLVAALPKLLAYGPPKGEGR